MQRIFGLLALTILASFITPVRGVEKAEIDKSIERGVKGLLAQQGENGSWQPNRGITALAAVTLLECDVAATDKAIQKAAEFVRLEAIKSEETYCISTAILFLDRLGDPVDVPLLECLTVRLLAMQTETGGWTYFGMPVPEDEKKRLEEHYKKAKEKKPEPIKKNRTARDLAPEVQQRLLQIASQKPPQLGLTDNSNTQFATLAVWVGRRHGVPVDGALARLDARFRSTQNADGGWGYRVERDQDNATSPSMTCAAVLGLSVAHGLTLMTGKPLGPNARPVLDPVRDTNLRAALACLGRFVDDPPSTTKKPIPKLVKNDIYFLWALERIMVAMDQERLNTKDWHNWGAEILIKNQRDDGRWFAEYGECGADTCFALLFLRKANLASDLTATLKSKAGDFILKAGGSFEKEPKKDPKPMTDPKPSTDPKTAKPPAETRPTFTQSKSAARAEALVKATSTEQSKILLELRDGKGVECTEALAGAIPQLNGESKRRAREALAERLTRMKADTLARYLADDDTEIRRAAALASGTREFKDQVPQLIDLLNDKDQSVVLAAHTALKAMTGQKIGPTPEPWRTWWKSQEKK